MFFRYRNEKVFCAHQLHIAAVLINFLRIFSKLYRYRTPILIKDQLSKKGFNKVVQKSIFAVRELVLLFPETNECLDVTQDFQRSQKRGFQRVQL